MKVLVIFCFDSQLKVASHLAKEFSKRNCEITYRKLVTSDKQLSANQLEQFSVVTAKISEFKLKDIAKDCQNFSFTIMILESGYFRQILEQIRGNSAAQANVVITGMMGVTLFDGYYGLLSRSNADLLFVNSQRELDMVKNLEAEFGKFNAEVVVSGLPFLESQRKDQLGENTCRDAIVFAGQPDVPSRLIERIYIVEQLIHLARKYPQKRVILKPRHKPTETTINKTIHHYEVIVKTYFQDKQLPKNFEISYESIPNLLKKTSLLLTISSTALVEAMAEGCRVAVISDFGVAERYGNHVFLGGKIFASFSEIIDGYKPDANFEWFNQNINAFGESRKIICDAAFQLAATERERQSNPSSVESYIWEKKKQIAKLNSHHVRRLRSLVRYLFRAMAITKSARVLMMFVKKTR